MQDKTIRIDGAHVILRDEVIETNVLIADGQIVELGGTTAADEAIDGRGRYLAPGLVDIHGDAFERQVMPRPKVFFPIEAALLETDRQLAGNGIATAFHALTLSWEPGLRSAERGAAFLKALMQFHGRFTVDHRVQLRWETFAFEAIPLIQQALESPLQCSIAFNDHTSMMMRDRDTPLQERLFEHNPNFAVSPLDEPRFRAQRGNGQRAGLSDEEYIDLLVEIWQRRSEVPGAMRQVAEMGRRAGAPMLSHDDTQDETRTYYRKLGAQISEFPMRLPVTEAAKAAGDWTVFGAPNVVRGGSHIGSLSAADMVEARLCDCLASDYYYPSMLAAVARLHQERRAPLPHLWSLVSSGPATASGLGDRGVIELGKRADLVLLDWPEGRVPAAVMTLCQGQVAYRSVRN